MSLEALEKPQLIELVQKLQQKQAESYSAWQSAAKLLTIERNGNISLRAEIKDLKVRNAALYEELAKLMEKMNGATKTDPGKDSGGGHGGCTL